jgi:hypothetical protein
MSYWSAGYRGAPTQKLLNLHKLSVFFAKKHFSEVHLITDSAAANHFKGTGFTSISTELDSLDTQFGKVWSLGKILAYKLAAQKGDPFIHIDYDVFLLKPLENRILTSEVFVQSPENVIHWFYEIDTFLANCPDLQKMRYHKPTYGVNMGIFGGNDLEFIDDYATESLSMVYNPLNKNFWLNFHNFKDDKAGWKKAVFIEQYIISVISQKYKKQITYLFNDYPKESEAKEKGYIHLLAAKNEQDVFDKVNFLLQRYKL